MKVNELIHQVNDEGKDIYKLSEECGFSPNMLRSRLRSLGYIWNKTTKRYEYNGPVSKEPLDEVIDYPSRRQSTVSVEKENVNILAADLFAAFLQLPMESKKVTTSFKTNEAIVNRMKLFSQQTSLSIGKLYSLALHEFLEKYEQGIKDLKSK